MSTVTRNFTVERTVRKEGVIVEVAGWLGRWPFRRKVSYHVGINCEVISAEAACIYVRRRGWTIAVGSSPEARGFSWAAILLPRHARGADPERSGAGKSPWLS
jgi:hypothetical protein